MNNWCEIYQIPYVATLDTKVRAFQYKVLNQILYTRNILYKINKSETDKCMYCNTETETMEYLLFYCCYSRTFWAKFRIFSSKFYKYDSLGIKDIIFGIVDLENKKHILFNHLLLGKFYLYQSSVVGHIPSWNKYIKDTERKISQK